VAAIRRTGLKSAPRTLVQSIRDRALVHGVGQLTARQRRSVQQTKPALAAAQITVDDSGYLALDEGAVRRCADLCAELIEWVDVQTQ
jgi:hypothetical protein